MQTNSPAVRTHSNRHEAVNSLVKSLRTNPSQKEWTQALDAVLNRHWPTILEMPSDRQDAAIEEFLAAVTEAKAKAADVQLTLAENLLLTALSLEGTGEPIPYATEEQRKFFSNLRFGCDERDEVCVCDALGRPLNTTVQ